MIYVMSDLRYAPGNSSTNSDLSNCPFTVSS